MSILPMHLMGFVYSSCYEALLDLCHLYTEHEVKWSCLSVLNSFIKKKYCLRVSLVLLLATILYCTMIFGLSLQLAWKQIRDDKSKTPSVKKPSNDALMAQVSFVVHIIFNVKCS